MSYPSRRLSDPAEEARTDRLYNRVRVLPLQRARAKARLAQIETEMQALGLSL